MLVVSPVVSKLVADEIAREAEATAARTRMLDEARGTNAGSRAKAGGPHALARLFSHLSPGARPAQSPGATVRCQPDTV